jgi:hypothetical protein
MKVDIIAKESYKVICIYISLKNENRMVEHHNGLDKREETTQSSIPSVTGFLTAIGKGKAQATATDKKPENNAETISLGGNWPIQGTRNCSEIEPSIRQEVRSRTHHCNLSIQSKQQPTRKWRHGNARVTTNGDSPSSHDPQSSECDGMVKHIHANIRRWGQSRDSQL